MNGFAIFQKYINNTLLGYLSDFYTADINNIVILSDSKFKYYKYIKRMLEKLCKTSF